MTSTVPISSFADVSELDRGALFRSRSDVDAQLYGDLREFYPTMLTGYDAVVVRRKHAPAEAEAGSRYLQWWQADPQIRALARRRRRVRHRRRRGSRARRP